jgi:uncharacterized protein YndB with AHSA1/START domain
MTTGETRLAMRRSIWIQAEPDRIWKEFETPGAMAAWWEAGGGGSQKLDRFEPGEGGWFEISGTHADFEYRLGGRILEWLPPGRMAIEWDSLPSGEWPQPMRVDIVLTAHLGGTVVEFVMTGFEELGETATRLLNSFEHGWDLTELAALKRSVEG